MRQQHNPVVAASNKPTKSSAGGSAPKYKKAPDAPKRFKSAFIIFSAEKHKLIKEDLTKQGRAEKVCCRPRTCAIPIAFLRVVVLTLLAVRVASWSVDDRYCKTRFGSLEGNAC
jgi:hypothetical protein